MENLFAELDETNKLQAWMKAYLASMSTAIPSATVGRRLCSPPPREVSNRDAAR